MLQEARANQRVVEDIYREIFHGDLPQYLNLWPSVRPQQVNPAARTLLQRHTNALLERRGVLPVGGARRGWQGWGRLSFRSRGLSDRYAGCVLLKPQRSVCRSGGLTRAIRARALRASPLRCDVQIRIVQGRTGAAKHKDV